MMERKGMDRRSFLGSLSVGLVGASLGSGPRALSGEEPATLGDRRAPEGPTKVALVKGEDRRRNMYEALKSIEKEVRAGIGNRQVIIKPNFVSTSRQLAATHVEGVMGMLDFLKPFYKKTVIIAESPAGGPAERGYENFGYKKLPKDYDVALRELDGTEHRTLYMIDTTLRPAPIRVARMLCDPSFYVISAAVMKTHNAVVATLAWKNILVGAPLKFGRRNDKRVIHQGTKLLNYNLFLLGRDLRPDLATIDGFEAMEGNGPGSGTPVDMKVAIASTDVLAADRIAVETMGIDFSKIGYLTYAARAGLGQGDREKIEVIGEDPKSCTRTFRLADSIEGQYKWQSDEFQRIDLEGDVRSD